MIFVVKQKRWGTYTVVSYVDANNKIIHPPQAPRLCLLKKKKAKQDTSVMKLTTLP